MDETLDEIDQEGGEVCSIDRIYEYDKLLGHGVCLDSTRQILDHEAVQ